MKEEDWSVEADVDSDSLQVRCDGQLAPVRRLVIETLRLQSFCDSALFSSYSSSDRKLRVEEKAG